MKDFIANAGCMIMLFLAAVCGLACLLITRVWFWVAVIAIVLIKCLI